jgi:dTDP-4-dehydrorhamnose reductase
MKVLVIGRAGQLGSELARFAWPTSYEVLQLRHSDCDLANPDEVGRVVRAAGPELVVNAAAYTAVDRAETEQELAMRVNGEGPAFLARACAETRAALIHISTDYVFDGTKVGAYLEDDAVNPLSIYGHSKLAGERAVRAHLAEHVILRTSWVFSSHGNNFVKTMLRLATQKQTIDVVADQAGAPTSARDIAGAIAIIAASIAEGRSAWGTFHYASEEPTTWFGFARAVFAGRKDYTHINVMPITAADFGAAANRPANSLLDCARIHDVYGIDRPSWRKALESTLAELEPAGARP